MNNSERFDVEFPPELAAFIHAQIGKDFPSDHGVIRKAMRVLKEQTEQTQDKKEKTSDEKMGALRVMVHASIARGGRHTEADHDRSLAVTFKALREQGY